MHTSSQLLIATRNAGKVREFAELLTGLPLQLRHLAEFPHVPEAVETGSTFAENAALKARFYARLTGLPTLADDSGLEVDALGGAPGVYSARYAGEQATDAARNAKLLDELNRSDDRSRRARFVCVIAHASPSSEEIKLFEGVCEGRIASSPRGSSGFGYDPLFIPDGYEATFGELPAEIKNCISHRAHALDAASRFLRQTVIETQLDPS
ncbi:MAG TPA: XTP/dITP diphosphatase [Pyrinomonadaceae bacterium]|nr:XTP/dITP diphosphatase [Pyrinomonadaceae bacterium]